MVLNTNEKVLRDFRDGRMVSSAEHWHESYLSGCGFDSIAD